MSYSLKAKSAQEALERAKDRLPVPDNKIAFMKRKSRNGAITVMEVDIYTLRSRPVKSDKVASLGVAPNSLPDYREFQELYRACRDFAKQSSRLIWEGYKAVREDRLSAFYSARRRVYDEYLSSDEWQRKRSECFQFHGDICVDCNNNQASDIHHRHYDSLGDECPLNDLVPLCRECHEARHIAGNLMEKASHPQVATGRVAHSVFGVGDIVERHGEGERARIKVIFDDHGPKWLVEGFAHLKDVE